MLRQMFQSSELVALTCLPLDLQVANPLQDITDKRTCPRAQGNVWRLEGSHLDLVLVAVHSVESRVKRAGQQTYCGAWHTCCSVWCPSRDLSEISHSCFAFFLWRKGSEQPQQFLNHTAPCLAGAWTMSNRICFCPLHSLNTRGFQNH